MRPAGSQSEKKTTKYDASGNVTSVSVVPRSQSRPGDNQANVGLFADNIWNPGKQWTVTLGGRADLFQTDTGTSPVLDPVLAPLYAAHASRTTVAETGSLGVIYHWSPDLDLVGNVGNVFRMPSDTELFTSGVQGTGYSLPNPALKPERGEAFEGGFRLHRNGLSANVTAYYDLYRDFVETVPVTYMGLPSTQSQNVQRVELKGVEGDFDARLSEMVSFYGNFTYTRATDLMADKPLAYIAPLHGIAGLRYTPEGENYSLHAAVDWSVAKTRIDPSQEYPTGSYGVIDIGGEVSLDPYAGPALKNTRLIVTIDNLLNAAYRSGATYASMAYPESMTNPLLEPGRNLTVTLRHRF
jgi:hemoglobin/transferrin/lactoferrin receptor protein